MAGGGYGLVSSNKRDWRGSSRLWQAARMWNHPEKGENNSESRAMRRNTSTRKARYDCFWGRWERGGMTWLPFRLEKIKLLVQTNSVSVKDWENLPIMTKKKTKHIAAQTIRRTGRYQLKKKSHANVIIRSGVHTLLCSDVHVYIHAEPFAHTVRGLCHEQYKWGKDFGSVLRSY